MSLQERILTINAGIYDAALRQSEWALTLRQLSDLLGGTAVSLFFDSATGRRVVASYGFSEEAGRNTDATTSVSIRRGSS